MTGIIVRPDTVYGLGVVPVRFTVEQGIPQWAIPIMAKPIIEKAIEHFEKLGDGKGHKYRFRADIPIRFEYSRLQADPYDLHTKGILNYEERLFGQGLVDCVAYLTFEQPLIIPTEEMVRPLERADGNFVNTDELPEELRNHLEEDENGEPS